MSDSESRRRRTCRRAAQMVVPGSVTRLHVSVQEGIHQGLVRGLAAAERHHISRRNAAAVMLAGLTGKPLVECVELLRELDDLPGDINRSKTNIRIAHDLYAAMEATVDLRKQEPRLEELLNDPQIRLAYQLVDDLHRYGLLADSRVTFGDLTAGDPVLKEDVVQTAEEMAAAKEAAKVAAATKKKSQVASAA